METPTRPAPFHAQLDDNFARVGRALAGGSPQAIAKAVFNCQDLRVHLLRNLTGLVNAEVAELCKKSSNPPSVFRKIPVEKLSTFQWQECIAELESKAPILLQVVTALVSCNDKRNTHKKGVAHHPGVCMAIAILLKERNREMCGIQTIVHVSLVLFTSCVQKQVGVIIL